MRLLAEPQFTGFYQDILHARTFLKITKSEAVVVVVVLLFYVHSKLLRSCWDGQLT